MAEQATAKKEKEVKEKEPEAPAAKKFPLKTLLLLAAVLTIEGAVISGAFLLAGRPAGAEGAAPGVTNNEAMALEKPIEELVVADKFQNNRSGHNYIYDTEIYIVVHKKYDEKIKAELEETKAQIRQDIRTIIGRAEPAQLLEPTLATLSRQIRAVLDERLGKDEEGKAYVQDVLITKCTQFKIDM